MADDQETAYVLGGKPDFQALERDVIQRIRLLSALWPDEQELRDPLKHKIAVDMLLPMVTLLAQFCSSIEIGEPEESDLAQSH